MLRYVLMALIASATLVVPAADAHAQDDWGVVGRCADMEVVDPSLIVPLPSRRPGTHASQWSGTIQYSATYTCEDCEGGSKYSWSAQHLYTFVNGRVTASGSVRDHVTDKGVPNSGITVETVAKGDVAFSRVSMSYSPLWQPRDNARPVRNAYVIEVGCVSDSKSPLIEGTLSEKGVGGGDSYTEKTTKIFGAEPHSHELTVYAQGPANATTLTGTYRGTDGDLVRTWTVNLRRTPSRPAAPKNQKKP